MAGIYFTFHPLSGNLDLKQCYAGDVQFPVVFLKKLTCPFEKMPPRMREREGSFETNIVN